MSYYSYKEIDETGAAYRLVIGQRSNGKTFGAIRKVIDCYLSTGVPSAYIRRLEEQIKKKNLEDLLTPHCNYLIEKTGGEWNAFAYRSGAFYLALYVPNSAGRLILKAKDKNPILRCYAINNAENTKGQDAGEVKYIIFDEFITRKYYLRNEFVQFQNLLSSIIRDRPGVVIYMLANSVNKYCPYFADMGIKSVADMQQGTISVYQLGQTDKKIAVEYCSMIDDDTKKEVSTYFAFDNPQLKMISSGEWEIALYRYPPDDMADYDIIFSFFVCYADKVVQGDIYMYKGYPLIVWHKKTTPLKHPEKDLIYCEDVTDGNPLHQIELAAGSTKPHKLIRQLIRENKTFYDHNDTGEIINNWLKFAMQSHVLKA